MIDIILLIISVLIIIEGCYLLFFSKKAKALIRSIKQDQWRIIGFVELIAGIVLFVVAFLKLL